MNKWLVLGMDGNRKWFFCTHGSSHFHVLGNATGWITISSPPWWKELLFFELFLPLTCPSPELGTQSSQFLVGVRAVTGHPEHREQRQAPEQHIPYGKTEETSGYWLGLTKGILVHSNKGPATRKDCAVSSRATVSAVESPWHSCRVTGVMLQQALQLSNCTNSISSCSNL